MRPNARWARSIEPYLYILPAGLLMMAFIASSVAYNIGISFFKWNLGLPGRPFTALHNYAAVLSQHVFAKVLLTSLLWTVLGVGLQMVLGVTIALVVDRLRGWRATLMQTSVLLPWIIPGVVATLIWTWMLQADLGVVNNLLWMLRLTDKPILWLANDRLALGTVIVMNTWKAVPFWFLMITAALRDLPRDQVEAARIDGAPYRLVFSNVILQHLKPVITATCTLTTIWTFNYFDLIWVATKGGPLDATSTLPVYTYRLAFESFDYGRASALAVVSLLIVAVVCLPYVRSMLKGVSEGALQ